MPHVPFDVSVASPILQRVWIQSYISTPLPAECKKNRLPPPPLSPMTHLDEVTGQVDVESA
jgi:hypothetical protein